MKLFLRVTTGLLFIAGIIWLIVDPGFDALTAFLTGILTLIGSFVVDKKGETETLDQRNRRIMLGHVENFWVKGILEKSLHGAALLDLGIKEDPDALNYPWAIKREANKETLPAGTSMLEIFQEIGMGRSLLILGAPGSGKTTMLLELARMLIERARENVTEPIPVVFNLSSWIKELTLADWLARELNIIYTIPRKIAPTWVTENRMLLLLDGLDEVKQESRGKCVDAINQFRKENGLTSVAVCSRIQDYAELKTRLSFDGAIEIQPLTSKQVDKYFMRFGKGLASIRQVLKNDASLREVAETPLFLSIMTLAYQGNRDIYALGSSDKEEQRKHLFDAYIERMLERPRSKRSSFKKEDVLRWLSWLAGKMIENYQISFSPADIQSTWLDEKTQVPSYNLIVTFLNWLICLLLLGSIYILITINESSIFNPIGFLILMLFLGLLSWFLSKDLFSQVDTGNAFAINETWMELKVWLRNRQINISLVFNLTLQLVMFGGAIIINYCVLRVMFTYNEYLPLRLVPFLNHATDLIFLRRMGNRYIFIHRLLLDHFAAKGHEKEINSLAAIPIDPRNAIAYYNRGLDFMRLGDKKKSIEDFTQAIKIDPKDGDAYIFRGLEYLDMGDLEKAIKDFSQAIQSNTRDTDVYSLRGECYRDIGERELAILDFQKYIEVTHDPEEQAWAEEEIKTLKQP